MGFREDIEIILAGAPKERQTILFSATMSKEIMHITNQYLIEPELIKITHKQLTVPSIEQLYFEVPVGKKVEALSRLLDTYNPGRSMVFCNTKRMVDELVSELQLRGYSSSGLHGDMKQVARTQIMNSFKNGKVDILVATDVAARGIDVYDIEAVFNYDIPQDVEYYVHRIGRTGRAGKDGRSFTFVSGRRQINELINIQNFIKTKIELRAIPSSDEVMEVKSRQFSEKIKTAIDEGGLERYNKIVDALLEENSSLDIACALIKMLMDDNSDIKSQKSDDAVFAIKIDRERSDNRVVKSKRNNENSLVKIRSKVHDDHDMVNLSISIGRNNRVSPGHILSAVAGASGLPGKVFGRIEVLDKYTLIGVPSGHVKTVLDAMNGYKIMGKNTTTKKHSLRS